ncbi:hypothetical protein KCP73_21630 [Salmonella enterica subsp. enterica]|nr:hypothetical protein KCP73_21630 [Salmonella enterica subsp. enterica]
MFLTLLILLVINQRHRQYALGIAYLSSVASAFHSICFRHHDPVARFQRRLAHLTATGNVFNCVPMAAMF